MLQLNLNVPDQILERAIAKVCAPVGHALSVKVRRLPSVYALIEMSKREQADELAVKFGGSTFGSHALIHVEQGESPIEALAD